MNEEILADFFNSMGSGLPRRFALRNDVAKRKAAFLQECFKPFANYVIARPQAVAIRYPLNETNPEGI